MKTEVKQWTKTLISKPTLLSGGLSRRRPVRELDGHVEALRQVVDVGPAVTNDGTVMSTGYHTVHGDVAVLQPHTHAEMTIYFITISSWSYN